jgi:hypothetical protein
VVGIVRWKSPQATLETINQWTGLRIGSSTVAAEVFDKGMAELIAYDAPVDALVTLDSKSNDFTPLAAVSVGVRSIDEARSAAQLMGAVSEVHPGEYKITLRRGKRRGGDKPFCVLRTAVGRAPARVVCGSRERDVNALSAYMTHTLPTRDFGASDVHLEMHAPPAMQLYGTLLSSLLRGGSVASRSKLELGEPAFDRAIDAATSGVTEELIALAGDLDTLVLDASLAPEHVAANLSLHLKGQQSWFAGTLASEIPREGPPPPMFWRLPADSTMAGYEYHADGHRFDAIRHSLGELLDGWLAHEGIAPGDRAPLTAIFSDKLASDTPWVSASGSFASSEPAAKKKGAAAPSDPLQTAIDDAGWHIIGVAAPNQVADSLKTLAAGISRPKIQALVRSQLTNLEKPTETAHAVKTSAPAVSLQSVAVPKELPKGSLDFELTVARDLLPPNGSAGGAAAPKGKSAPAAPLRLHILVVPEASQTWIALGGDRANLVKTVLGTLDGAPASGTLASRQDLDALKNGKLVGASFLTLESLIHSWVGALAARDQDAIRKLHETTSMLNGTPHKGKTPLFVTADLTATDGLTYGLRVDVPKGYIEDAIVLIASAGMSGLARP